MQGVLLHLFAVSIRGTMLSIYALVSSATVLLGLPVMYFMKNIRGLTQRVVEASIMLWVTIGALIISSPIEL